MNARTGCLVACLLLLLVPAGLRAQEQEHYVKNFGLTLGIRTLDDEKIWGPADRPKNLGVEVDFGRGGWPVQIVLGIEFASDQKEGMVKNPTTGEMQFSDIRTDLTQINLGIQHYFRKGKKLEPFLGGTLSALHIEHKFRSLVGIPGEKETPVGGVLKTGVRVRIARNFYLGGEARFLLGTDVEVFGVKGNADSRQLSALFSWRFD